MNERIKELMVQAFQSHYGDPITPGAREKAVELVSGWGEKFAELIVKECMACSTWVGKVNKNAIEPIHTAHAINQRIKKHFGVEE